MKPHDCWNNEKRKRFGLPERRIETDQISAWWRLVETYRPLEDYSAAGLYSERAEGLSMPLRNALSWVWIIHMQRLKPRVDVLVTEMGSHSGVIGDLDCDVKRAPFHFFGARDNPDQQHVPEPEAGRGMLRTS